MNSKLGAIENLEFPQFSFYRSDDLCILQSVFRIHLAAFADYMRIKCNAIFVMCHFLGIKIHLWKSCKVEKILNGSLDLIPSPSPSVKIQIMGGKVCFRGKGQTFLALSTNFWKQKKVCWHQCFASLPKLSFPANSLNFHWGWRYRIQAIFL